MPSCDIFNHIHELYSHNINIEAIQKEKRIEIRYHVNYSEDSIRTFTIASIWYRLNDEYEPVMIIRSAGRDGLDDKDEFITNKPLYIAMVQYLLTFIEKDENDELDVYDPDKDIESLDKFYGRPVVIEMFGRLNDRKSWLFHLLRELVRRRNHQSEFLVPEPIVKCLYETLAELKELDPNNGIYHKIKIRLDVCGIDFPQEKIDEFFSQIDGVML